MNIISSSGLTIYNVTQLGTAEGTGVTTVFQITPDYGYLIAAGQFTATNVSDYPEVSAITFQDTLSAYEIGNVVNVIVTWNGTTSLTTDYFLNLQISVDDTVLYDSNAVFLDFSLHINEPLDSQVAPNFTVEPIHADEAPTVSDLNITTPNPNVRRFQGYVNTDETVVVADVIVSVNTEGGQYIEAFNQFTNDWFSYAIDQPDTSNGQFVFEYFGQSLDDFGNAKGIIYRIYYTRQEYEQTDIGTNIGFDVNIVSYYAIFAYNTVTLDSQAGDEYILTFYTNIPFTTSTFNLTFSDTWAEIGDTNETISGLQVSYPIDYSAIPLGVNSRNNTVTLKDTFYPSITRDTLVLNQYEAENILLEIQLNPPGEYVSDDSPTAIQFGSTAKVISYNNGNSLIDENAFLGNNPQNPLNAYDTPFTGSVAYMLRAEVDSQVTLEDFNNGNVNLQITQDQYPEDSIFGNDWCDFSTTEWYEAAPGLFKRVFYIRNQDAFNFQGALVNSSDRTATITATHPNGVASSTVTITQDDRYTAEENGGSVKIAELFSSISSEAEQDTAFGAISYSTTTSNPNNTVHVTNTTNSAGVTGYVVRIKFDDLDFDFNLYNNVTTNQSAPNFKQYPDPTFYGLPGGVLVPGETVYDLNGNAINLTSPQIVYDDDSFFADYSQTLTFNSNYDASNPNEDHHYTFSFTLQNNDTFSDRPVYWYFKHPKNENAGQSNNDVAFKIIQTAVDQVSVDVIGGEQGILPIYDETEPYIIDADAQSVNLSLTYSGNVLPTIGLYDFQNGYTPLAQGEVVNGISYVVNNDTVITDNNSDGVADGVTRTVTVTYTSNSTADNRENILGFWHPNANPNTDPLSFESTDGVLIRQQGAVYDEGANAIILYNTESENQPAASNSITFLINVTDYTNENFSSNTNNPVVQAWRWAGTGFESGQYSDPDTGEYNDGVLTSPNELTVTVNPQYNSTGPLLTASGASVNYTHTATISYSENTLEETQFIAVRARHSLNSTFNIDDYIFITISTSLTATITHAYRSTQEEGPIYGEPVQNDSEMVTANSLKRITLPADTTDLTLRVKVKNYFTKLNHDYNNNYSNFEDSNFPFHNPSVPYIVMRFLDPNYASTVNGTVNSGFEKVWKNPETSDYTVLNSDSWNNDYYDGYVPGVDTTAKHFPLTFYNPEQENSEFIIEMPGVFNLGNNDANRGSIENEDHYQTNSTTAFNFASFPDNAYFVSLKVNPQQTGGLVNSFIGVWTYESMPFTNVYRLDQDFIVSTSYYTEPYNFANTIGFISSPNYVTNTLNDNLELIQGINQTDNFNDLEALNFIKNNLLEVNSTFDGWDWNRGNVTFDYGARVAKTRISLYADSSLLKSQNFQENQDSLSSHDLVYVSFTISNFEAIGGLDTENTSSSGNYGFVSLSYGGGGYNTYYSAPFNPNDIGYDVDNSALQHRRTIQDSIGFRGNGDYYGYFAYEANAKNNINFHTYFGCRYTLSNLKIWFADREQKLEPGSGVTFDRPPDDIILIKHESVIESLSFGTDGFNGSCISAYNANIPNEATETLVPSANSEGATISPLIGTNNYNNVIYLNFQNQQFTSPQIRVWDGVNNSVLISAEQPMIQTFEYTIGGPQVGTVGVGILFSSNYTGSTREITFGLYNGNPSSSTQAPLDTFTITQDSATLLDLGA